MIKKEIWKVAAVLTCLIINYMLQFAYADQSVELIKRPDIVCMHKFQPHDKVVGFDTPCEVEMLGDWMLIPPNCSFFAHVKDRHPFTKEGDHCHVYFKFVFVEGKLI